MHITEETPLGFDVDCNCGHTIFALRGSGVVTCISCGRERDPRRLLYKWLRFNNAEEPDTCQAY